MKRTGIIKYFLKPTTRNDRPFYTLLIYIVIVSLVLSIFEPFQYRLNNISQFIVLIGFDIVLTISYLFFTCIVPIIFHHFYKKSEWTIGKNYIHYLSFLIITGILIFIYDYFLLGYKVHTPQMYFNGDFFYILYCDMLASITIGIIPISIDIFMTQNRTLKHYLADAKQLQNIITNKENYKKKFDDQIIFLSGETKDSITLTDQSILYLESTGNYINICYWEGQERYKLIRSTIKQMEETLKQYPKLIRCHRAFIVNTNHIINIRGNSQGYRLTLKNCSHEIPVSRSYTKDIKDLFIHPNCLG